MTFVALCVHVARATLVEALLILPVAAIAITARGDWAAIRDALAGRHGA